MSSVHVEPISYQSVISNLFSARKLRH